MKHLVPSRFMRMSMVTVLAFGLCGEVNAQFGGLLNAAKKKAKEAVNKTANNAINGVVSNNTDNTVTTTESNANTSDVTPLYYASGTMMGEWNAKTRQFKQMDKNQNVSHTFTFQSDGSVVAEDGRQIGVIEADGTMNTVQTKGIKLNPETGEVTRNGEWFGKIGDDRGMYLFNEKMGWSNAVMDKQVQAFILFNLIATDDMLTGFKKKYDEQVKFNEQQRQQKIANARASAAASRNGSASGAVQLWKGGSVAGEIRANNEVWIGGSCRGRFESNGNIWVGGSVAGIIHSSGEIRKGGSIIGKVQNGKVWLGGSIVGEIRQNGDVVKGGSVVGRAPGFKNACQVAVIYFFGFYNF